MEDFKQHWLWMTPFRLVLWLPLAWWGWWAAALPILWHYRCFFFFKSKIKRVLVPLNQTWRSFYTRGCLKVSLWLHVCREEASWTCLEWWRKWWETWWASHYRSLLSFPNKTRLGAADPCPTIAFVYVVFVSRKEWPEHRTARRFPPRRWSLTPLQAPALLKSTSRPVKQQQAPEGWEYRTTELLPYSDRCFFKKKTKKKRLFLLATDPRDTAVAQGQREWTRESRHRPPHRRPRTHSGAVTEPSHRRPRGTPGLHQPRREWVLGIAVDPFFF